MGGRIECFIDIASLYSYLAFVHLRANRDKLEAHGVEVEFHPVFLGAINASSGNKPPWMLPAKAKYGIYDAIRSTARAGMPDVSFPDDLMAMGHTVLPLRALHFVKSKCPRDTYEALFSLLFDKFWSQPNLNVTKFDVFTQVLAEKFSPEEVKTILAAASRSEVKDALKNATQQALDRGAFGAPWLWVTNGEGKGEPFFGSDRFHFVYKYLGLPFQDIELLPPSKSAKPKL